MIPVLGLLAASSLMAGGALVALRILRSARLREAALLGALVAPVVLIPFSDRGLLEACGRLLHRLVEGMPPALTWGLLGKLVVLAAVLSLAGTLLRLARQRRMLRACRALPAADQRRVSVPLSRLAGRAGIQPPAVLVAPGRTNAWTVGLRRPVIVLGANLPSLLDDEELAAVLAHEVAHIARRDNLVRWAVRLFAGPFAFFPTSVLIPRLLDREREKAADDATVALTGQPLVFADALVKIWRGGRAHVAPRWVAANHLVGGPLAERIERLLGDRPSGGPTQDRTSLLLGPIFGILLVVVAAAELRSHGRLDTAFAGGDQAGIACPHRT